MKLYVMRHGHSPSAAESGVGSDAERPLSAKGRSDARAQAERLLKDGAKPQAILHSPLRRAVETAQEAAAALNIPAREFLPLRNEIGPEELAAVLPVGQYTELLIVGHQPQVGELCAWLADEIVDFKPAGLAAVELEGKPAPRKARLLWSAAPGAP